VKPGYVYILTNRSKTFCTGVTSDLENRIFQHKNHWDPGFTRKYKIDRLVYFERFRRHPRCDRARKADQGPDPAEEDGADRLHESGVAGLERRLVRTPSLCA